MRRRRKTDDPRVWVTPNVREKLAEVFGPLDKPQPERKEPSCRASCAPKP